MRLRDLQQLSDQEITGWGDRVVLTAYYYQYFDFSIGFAADSILEMDPAFIIRELASHEILQTAFNRLL